MSDFQKWSVLAFRAMDDAGRVLMTIEPESTTEGERLDQLKQTIRELLVQALLLNGVWTRRQLDERFHFGKLDNDWLNMQLGREQQAEPVACKTLCELCVKRGYDFCANVAKTTPIIISPTPPQQQAEPVLQTCNCRWDGDVQVQQCTLHEAHVDAIHEWAERAKVAERKLEQQAEPVATMKMLHTYGTAPPQQQAEPIGWLDGNDKLAEFMHRDLKAEHDKRGSATPRDFTVPVYTTPPQQQAEPVAWIVDGGKKNGELLHAHEYALELVAPKIMCKPLYTTPPQRKPLTCVWSPEDDDAIPSTYHSACGELWSFIDGGWKDNCVNFCHGCGGKVIEPSSGIQEPKP